MAEEVCEEYRSSLEDLKFNSKPLINVLTMLAEENIQFARFIVQIIEAHLKKPESDQLLPVMYLIDSIIKNVGKDYVSLFRQNIVSNFCYVFEKGDEKVRMMLFKLRQTWSEVFNPQKLHAIDLRVQQVDPAWPVANQANQANRTSVHVNPKFIGSSNVTPETPAPPLKSKNVEEDIMEKLKQKHQELMRLQQQKLQLELLETKKKLSEQTKQLNEVKCRQFKNDVPETNAPPIPPPKTNIINQPQFGEPRFGGNAVSARDPRLQSKPVPNNGNSKPAIAKEPPLPILKGNTTLSADINSDQKLKNKEVVAQTRTKNSKSPKKSKSSKSKESSSRNKKHSSSTKSLSKSPESKSSDKFSKIDSLKSSAKSKVDAKKDVPRKLDKIPKKTSDTDIRGGASTTKREYDNPMLKSKSEPVSKKPKSHEPFNDLCDGQDKDYRSLGNNVIGTPTNKKEWMKYKCEHSDNQSPRKSQPEYAANPSIATKDTDMRTFSETGERQLPSRRKLESSVQMAVMVKNKAAILKQAEEQFRLGQIDDKQFAEFQNSLGQVVKFQDERKKQLQVKDRQKNNRRKIMIDNKMREIRFENGCGIVMMDDHVDHLIYFKGDGRNVRIDNKEIFLSFNGEKVGLEIDGKRHYFMLGGPTQELFVDDTPYEVRFGGPPIGITLNGKVFRAQLQGPPPDVDVRPLQNRDIQRNLSIDANNELTNEKNDPSKATKCDVDERWANSSISNSKNDQSSRPFKKAQQSMDDSENKKDNWGRDGPWDKRPLPNRHVNSDQRDSNPSTDFRFKGPHNDSVTNDNQLNSSDTNKYSNWNKSIEIHTRDRDTFRKDAHQPELGKNFRDSSSQGRPRPYARPTQQGNPQFSGLIAPQFVNPPNQAQNRMPPPNAAPPSLVPGHVSPRPALLPLPPNSMKINPLPNINTPKGLPPMFNQESLAKALAPMGPPPGPMMPPTAQMLPPTPLVPTSVPMVPTSAPMVPPLPAPMIFLPTPMALNPMGSFNATSLFEKLLNVGIISKSESGAGYNVSKKENEEAENVVEKVEHVEVKPKDVEKKEEVVVEEMPVIKMDSASLKKNYPAVMKMLYTGTKCESCGVRFSADNMDKYGQHLDWHFRSNRREKDGAKKASSRKWYYEVEDWIQFEEIEDLEERAQSFFEVQAAEEQGAKPVETTVYSVPISDINSQNICKVCGEEFEHFWDEEEESWHLKDAIRVSEKAYHPLCYEDSQKREESSFLNASQYASDSNVLPGLDLIKEEEKIFPIDPANIKKEPEDTSDTAVPPIELAKIKTEPEPEEPISIKMEPEDETIKKEPDDNETEQITDPMDTSVPSKEGEAANKITDPPTPIMEENNEENPSTPLVDESEADPLTPLADEATRAEPERVRISPQTGSAISLNLCKSTVDSKLKPVPSEDASKECVSQIEDAESEEEMQLPPPDPRFAIQDPVLRGTELSGLCSIM